MQQRGETLATIAELTGASVSEIRALLRHAPKAEKHTAGAPSGALGGAELDAGEHQAANPAVTAGDVSGGATVLLAVSSQSPWPNLNPDGHCLAKGRHE
jgi:hypothetical protein